MYSITFYSIYNGNDDCPTNDIRYSNPFDDYSMYSDTIDYWLFWCGGRWLRSDESIFMTLLHLLNSIHSPSDRYLYTFYSHWSDWHYWFLFISAWAVQKGIRLLSIYYSLISVDVMIFDSISFIHWRRRNDIDGCWYSNRIQIYSLYKCIRWFYFNDDDDCGKSFVLTLFHSKWHSIPLFILLFIQWNVRDHSMILFHSSMEFLHFDY